jgi:hypothetical protein
MNTEYAKIYSPFKRFTEGPQRNKLDTSQWVRPEFEVLADMDWHWTEKVDGTNIRVIWDGHRVSFAGRTDNAQIPPTLLKTLDAMFPEELLEQQFGSNSVVLYGEGYGAKIQKVGGSYRPDQSFVLFDVKIGAWWLEPEDVSKVAVQMGIDRVPVWGTISLWSAIERVRSGFHSSWGDFFAEGLVGRPPLGLLGRDGDRLLVKVKHVDFYGGAA